MALVMMISTASQAASVVVETSYSDELCDDLQQIAKDYVELELAGGRWQGGEPSCLKRLNLKTIPSERMVQAADPGLLDPEYLLPLKRELDFKVRRLPDDLIEVRYSYLGRKAGKDVPVQDLMLLRLNFGRARDIRGCASPFQPPLHLVMRSGCSQD